jgi:hypothetical protein
VLLVIGLIRPAGLRVTPRASSIYPKRDASKGIAPKASFVLGHERTRGGALEACSVASPWFADVTEAHGLDGACLYQGTLLFLFYVGQLSV